MTLNPSDALKRTIALAVKSHQGQRDKAGQPYILHVLRVMHAVNDPIAKQAAVLHDYIEDVGGTVEELIRHEISEPAIQAVKRLSKPDHVSYCDYVISLSSDPIAVQVKMADLEDNYRIGRVAYRAGHEADDAKRIQKYALTYQFLSQAISADVYRKRMVGLE